jgi:hypothetical protein
MTLTLTDPGIALSHQDSIKRVARARAGGLVS